MTLIKDVPLRGADGKLLDNIDSEQAKKLIDLRKARIICRNPLVLQMRLAKSIVVLSPAGIELEKTDMRKARKLIKEKRVRIVQERPLIIQFIKRSAACISNLA